VASGRRGDYVSLVATTSTALPPGLAERLSALFPGARISSVQALAPDKAADETQKHLGYGQPLRIELTVPGGAPHTVVFHLISKNAYGHDRRADRIAEVVLSQDTFARVPRHVRALDSGLVAKDGSLVSFEGTGEPYLLTDWAEGTLYAEDLRRVAASGKAEPLDVARAEGLATYLAALHRLPGTHPGAYTRCLRDTVGSGEGIAGIVDGYGDGAPGAPKERLERLEHACLDWRWKLKTKTERLRRTHGDFRPFNLVFAAGAGQVTPLDASRGAQGDPADDVTCLSVNYLFFGLEHRERWHDGLGLLWRRFWKTYLSEGDVGVLDAAAPFFAWRALVVCSPAWYPQLADADRARMLRFAEQVLTSPRFDPTMGEEAMR